VDLAHERGGSLRLTEGAHNPSPLDEDPGGSFFLAETATAAVLDTDLLTPLGAYLRLRERGRASFLLESVEQGRLGRYSLVGAGSRLLTYEEAERCGEPVVGYLAYDFVAKLEPTVPLPAAGRGLPESRFVAADALVRFDHVRGVAEILHGDADEIARAL
jgi:anthranilate/para-aminobenzoate synthase component I